MKLAIICSDEKGLERRLFRSIPKHSIRLHPRFPLLYLTRVQKRFVRRYSGEQFVILIFQPRKGNSEEACQNAVENLNKKVNLIRTQINGDFLY